MSESIRVLVADREATRLGIRMALHGMAIVCAEAEDSEQAIRGAKREEPDLCLVGSHIAGNNLAWIKGICRAAPRTAVVVLAQEGNAEELLVAVRAGAHGYMPNPLDPGRLRQVVRAVASNEAVIPRAMVLDLLLELRGTGSGGDGLSAREAQVLGLLRHGHQTADIATRLGIAPVTVRRHISDLVHKLGVSDRSALIMPPVPARRGWRESRVVQKN